MNRRALIQSFLCGLLSLSAVGCISTSGGPGSQESPNIIVILANDFGVETLSCYGSDSYRTPNLDRLAREGARLEHAYSQPHSTPARVEVLTGLSNARNYKAFGVLDPGERTFAHELQDAGYRTFAAGDWQLLGSDTSPASVQGIGTEPGGAGFDNYALWHVKTEQDRYWGATLDINGELQTLDVETYGPDAVLDAAIEWIDAEDARPFLLYWPMILAHSPFLATPRSEGPRSGDGDVGLFGSMVEYTDTLVGRLVAHLETRELENDTIVLFMGANGCVRETASYRDGRVVVGGRGRATDAGTHVPFIAWGPGTIPKSKPIVDPISTIDVFATVLDAANVTPDNGREYDSESLMPLLTGETVALRDSVAFHYHPNPITRPRSTPQRWARDADWLLFEDGRFFNVGADPRLGQPMQLGAASPEGLAAHARLQARLAELPKP